MPQDHFGESIAARYDARTAAMFDADVVGPAVELLAELAGDGDALELGVGTGRIALPLSARGVRVHGVDLSTAMLARLNAKPGAERVTTSVGDIATVRLDGRARVVYLVFDTIMNLTSQDEQVACFRTATAHLEPGGCFVVEVLVPDLRRLPPGETVRPFDISPEHLGFDEYDVVEQRLTSHHYWSTAGEIEAHSTPFRYVWPSELDLMAQIAGLRPVARWSDWARSPFTADSRSHVSVWELPDEPADANR